MANSIFVFYIVATQNPFLHAVDVNRKKVLTINPVRCLSGNLNEDCSRIALELEELVLRGWHSQAFVRMGSCHVLN